MQIVIEIPENLYKANINGLNAKEIWDLRVAIKNGTPLPKGHGDLIDKNKLAHKMIVEDVSRFKEESEALAGLFLRMCNKEQAIIKADKEDDDK